MRRRRAIFSAFKGETLFEHLRSKQSKIEGQVLNETEDYILNVNESEYVSYLVSQHSLEPLAVQYESVAADTHEVDIPYGRGLKQAQVITFYLPFIGSEILLRLASDECNHPANPHIFVEEGCICFEVEDIYHNPNTITKEKDKIESQLKHMIDHHNRAIDKYNTEINSFTQKVFHNRKVHLLRYRNTLAALNVPLRKRTDLPKTFAIPAPTNRRKITIRPEVSEKGYTPEPTLPVPVYREILQDVFNVGKNLERMPSTYQTKGEEDLRDYILLFLEAQYQGSATGETFNKTGKTDILLRYQNSNVFIAECKFWKGQKAYLDSITQLLGYLTWRDAKAAVILFVKNLELSTVLSTVKDVTPSHPNYLGFANEEEETWFNYRFHINDDRNREAQLAVLLFHLPSLHS